MVECIFWKNVSQGPTLLFSISSRVLVLNNRQSSGKIEPTPVTSTCVTRMINKSLSLHLCPMDDCVVSGTVCLSELSQFNTMLVRLGLALIWQKSLQSASLCRGFRRVGPFLWGKYSAIFFLLFQKENENLSISFVRSKIFGHFCISVNQQIQIWTFYWLDVN